MPADIPMLRDARLVDALTGVVSQAAEAVLAIRASALAPRLKADRSPVTAADEAAEAIILEGVSRLLPGVQIVSEEAVAHGLPQEIADCFVLVDPVDGTRELVAGRDEFTVNLAIVQDRRPVLGIVAAPAENCLWRGVAGGGAARRKLAAGVAERRRQSEWTPIRPRLFAGGRLVAAVSRSHLDARTLAFLARLADVERLTIGSSLKFCRLAEGLADLYPRLAPVHEWDIAAGHAVLAAAGGIVTTPDGAALSYGAGAQGLVVPGFLAWADPAAPARLGLAAPFQGDNVR
jgi:3'(2'), 5'-bisphosphate nucleotidase